MVPNVLLPWALQEPSVRRLRARHIHQERHYRIHHGRVKSVIENFQRRGALRDSLAYPFFEGEITSVTPILSTSVYRIGAQLIGPSVAESRAHPAEQTPKRNRQD